MRPTVRPAAVPGATRSTGRARSITTIRGGHRPRGPTCNWRRTSRRIISGRTWRGARRRSMTKLPRRPRPVPVGRYRYSKWRWRIAVRVLDALGALLIRPWRRLHAAPRIEDPRRILLVQLDHLGDAVLTSPLLGRLHAAYPT